ncbi:MAG: hypothetical protein ABSH51_09170 [Solirubrobacteraceae bacterium]|jgi:hypothetical protein
MAVAFIPATASASLLDPSSCFWSSAINVNTANYSYPDAASTYWYSGFNLPAGAKVVFRGSYPFSRYFSLQSYGSSGAQSGIALDAIDDVQISPALLSFNPFRPGGLRYLPLRSYSVTLTGAQPPVAGGQRAANTLYAGTLPATSTQPVRLVYRVELPDRGFDDTGGVGLPSVTVVLASGQQISGSAACSTLGVSTVVTSLGSGLPLSTYLALTRLPANPSIGASGSSPQAPAVNPIQWYRAVNACQELDPYYQAAGYPLNTPADGTPVCSNTFAVTNYQNVDNAYLSAYINRSFGPDTTGNNVLVLTGQMPTIGGTYDNALFFPANEQLRYWSLCTEESLYATTTTTSNGCLYDEQVPLNSSHDYTIVVSTAADRPTNATTACGVGWLNWPSGDGAPAPYTRPDLGQLLMRNQLTSSSFTQAIQDVPAPGLPANVTTTMGPYAPTGQYESVAQFEAAGCR